MSKVAAAMIKTNQTSFELIPEEDINSSEDIDIDIIMEQNKSCQGPGNNGSEAATTAQQQAAAQAALAAQILHAQQNLGNLPDLALFSQHQQQLIRQRVLEEHIARNRELLLQQHQESGNSASSTGDMKPFGMLFQVSCAYFKHAANTKTFKIFETMKIKFRGHRYLGFWGTKMAGPSLERFLKLYL